MTSTGRERFPPAAVVVATRNRAALLARLLDTLSRQQDAPPFEVLVVDDGSTDGTADRVEQTKGRRAFPVRLLRQEVATGPAGARNCGWRATDAPFVAFTDDDCMPASTWLGELTKLLESAGADFVAGPTTYPEDQADRRSTFAHWMEDDGHSGHYSTSNVMYRRAVLEALGGFDEGSFRYRRSGRAARCINGEDTDLAWRAIEAGFDPGFAPAAVVHHEVFPASWRNHLRDIPRLEGLVLLMKKHPQLRAHFGRRVIYRTEDAAALAVIASTAGIGSRRLRPLAMLGAAVTAAVYVWMFRRFRPPPRGRGGYLVAIPLSFVADSYAAMVMLGASVRYRTLLL